MVTAKIGAATMIITRIPTTLAAVIISHDQLYDGALVLIFLFSLVRFI